ncbi:hypothetical protein [Elizabethkingia occulta]|uniref:hypothetical protein n=1 Tax=Elizabethkingia occulta TaxID=1867263 RepID=UPI001055D7FA|nr:hypothetical protein [Elizabethkingia occulta]
MHGEIGKQVEIKIPVQKRGKYYLSLENSPKFDLLIISLSILILVIMEYLHQPLYFEILKRMIVTYKKSTPSDAIYGKFAQIFGMISIKIK